MRWNVEDLERYRLVKKSGLPVRLPEDMELLRNKPAYEINRILEEGPPQPLRAVLRRWPRNDVSPSPPGSIQPRFGRRILRYLKKQKQHWSTLQDYWHMAHRLHRDLNDSLVRWPRNLHAAHDQVMAISISLIVLMLSVSFLSV